MSVLRGPGILLNPITARQPVYLPQLFNLALAAPGANLYAVRDELGAIAYALHEGGKPEPGDRLFGILTLESEYSLAENRDDILACIAHAKLPFLRQAMRRSLRFFKETRPKLRARRTKSEVQIAFALCKHVTQAAAAEALGLAPGSISRRISQAAEDSLLGIFKGAFMSSATKGVSHDDVAAALKEHGTLTAAAKALGISTSTIARWIKGAIEDSPLYVFKGAFKLGRPRTKPSAEDRDAKIRRARFLRRLSAFRRRRTRG